jgi:hypothetical protein
VFDNLATRNAYNQVAASTKPQPLGAVEVEFNLPRVGARLNYEIVFRCRWLP